MRPPDSAHIGTDLCFSGAETNRVKCRKVIATKSEELGGIWEKVYVVPFGAIYRDSGAPVWNRYTHAAVRIISARNPNRPSRTFVAPLLTIPGESKTKAPGALHAPGMYSPKLIATE